MARKRGVDLAQVVDAAAGVADVEGLDRLTMAGVAGALGVRSPSLYSHVEGVAGLRRAMALEAARRLGSAIADAARDREGVEALRAIAHAYRTFALGHPSLYAAMLPVSSADDEEAYAVFAAPVRVIAEVLSELGVSRAQAVPVIRSFRSALHGFVALEAGGGFGMPDDVDDSFNVLVELVIAGVVSRSTAPAMRNPPTPC
ncbi:MAG TPA: WHG domain-containing protein [Acidimicrobiales bacterium]|nr:WHG domain-containing protein [Acidimicrobiales bacterium]